MQDALTQIQQGTGWYGGILVGILGSILATGVLNLGASRLKRWQEKRADERLKQDKIFRSQVEYLTQAPDVFELAVFDYHRTMNRFLASLVLGFGGLILAQSMRDAEPAIMHDAMTGLFLLMATVGAVGVLYWGNIVVNDGQLLRQVYRARITQRINQKAREREAMLPPGHVTH